MPKLTQFNINDIVRFQPTKAGRKHYHDQMWALMHDHFTHEQCTLKVDENGYARMPLWEVMHVFGEMMYMGAREMPIKDNVITLEQY
jgi:hypothetical protein